MLPKDISRRNFIAATTTGIIAASMNPFSSNILNINSESEIEVHIFSKHLQFLNIKEASKKAVELGFNGIDLTVRPKGHILPKNVKSELNNAIKTINDSGSSCKMITTAISDSNRPLDKDIIQIASEIGIEYYRCDWFTYHKNMNMTESLAIFKEKIEALSVLNRKHRIIGCYQNHAGTKIGSSYWEVEQLLSNSDLSYFGTQYDIRHATVDGALSWRNGFELLKNRIKTIVLKDFKWEKIKGEWKIINVPIGEGMVDFDLFFKLLKKNGLTPPASLHLEYPLGGAEKGHRSLSVQKDFVYNAMYKDLETIKDLWRKA